MADKKPAPTVTYLAGQRAKVLADITALQSSLAEVDAQLIALGAGRYADEDATVLFTVVSATEDKTGDPTYRLTSEAEEKARKIAGEAFAKLFDRTVTFAPCTAFADVVPKLLTPAAARDLVALCKVEGKLTKGKAAYVKAG